MANFEPAVELVLLHEGGFADDPQDPGGITNWGVTLPDLPKGSGPDDIRNLSRDAAKAIYHAKYWAPLRGDEIASQCIADIYMDLAVAKGLTGATTPLRMALGLSLPPIQWGRLDDVTIRAINAASAPQLAFDFLRLCDQSRIDRVMANPVLIKFLPGWLRRNTHNRAHVQGLVMQW